MSHRIVHVVWEDSAAAANADGVWQLRDAAPLAPKHIETAGILIQETEAHVTVAQSLTGTRLRTHIPFPRGSNALEQIPSPQYVVGRCLSFVRPRVCVSSDRAFTLEVLDGGLLRRRVVDAGDWRWKLEELPEAAQR